MKSSGTKNSSFDENFFEMPITNSNIENVTGLHITWRDPWSHTKTRIRGPLMELKKVESFLKKCGHIEVLAVNTIDIGVVKKCIEIIKNCENPYLKKLEIIEYFMEDDDETDYTYFDERNETWAILAERCKNIEEISISFDDCGRDEFPWPNVLSKFERLKKLEIIRMRLLV